MKTLQVIIVFIVYMFSFNNQVFSSEIDCDLQKINKIYIKIYYQIENDRDNTTKMPQ